MQYIFKNWVYVTVILTLVSSKSMTAVIQTNKSFNFKPLTVSKGDFQTNDFDVYMLKISVGDKYGDLNLF